MKRFIATLLSGAALAVTPAVAQDADPEDTDSMEELASETAAEAEETVSEAGEAMTNAAEETGEAMESAADETGEAMETAADETGEAMDAAGEDMERAKSDATDDMDDMKAEASKSKGKAEKDWSDKKAGMEKDASSRTGDMAKDATGTSSGMSSETKPARPGTKTIKRYNADGELVSTETVPADGTGMQDSQSEGMTGSATTLTSDERAPQMDQRFENELQSEIDMMNLAQLFIAIDQDNDGRIQKAEWADWQGRGTSATQQFAEVDVDGDGDVEYSEYIVANIAS